MSDAGSTKNTSTPLTSSSSSTTPSTKTSPEIITQGDGWIALNKPSGASIHSEDGITGYIANAELQLKQKLWPVHRLDKVTSGILLVATSAEAAAHLSAQFAERTVCKYYLAVSARKPIKKQGWIKGDMEKARNGCWKLARSHNNPAITRFVSHFDASTNTRFYLLKPSTGKTHQLRVAMKSISAPIHGDTRYGGTEADRAYLHAYYLSFEMKGQRIELSCLPSSADAAESSWPVLPDAWLTPMDVIS
jgi:tRNA pseudouridine32 synthase/23S rRNA pseudouridine746 synthase